MNESRRFDGQLDFSMPLMDPTYDLDEDIARVRRAAVRVLALINDPERLRLRALALEDGTASRVEGLL
jgi:hypothetical protein